MNGNGSTRKWRALRARVLREEPRCRIQGPGCTHTATTVDHIVPRSQAPHLTYDRSNLRGACAHCNYSRGDGTTTPRNPRPHKQPAALRAFFHPSTNPDAPNCLGA